MFSLKISRGATTALLPVLLELIMIIIRINQNNSVYFRDEQEKESCHHTAPSKGKETQRKKAFEKITVPFFESMPEEITSEIKAGSTPVPSSVVSTRMLYRY